jgi:hypothetical protein
MRYLHQKQAEWDDLDNLSRAAYLGRLNHLRSNYSDYYTYHLDDEVWEAEEYYLLDDVYTEKVARELYGRTRRLHWLGEKIKNRIRPVTNGRWTRRVVEDYVRAYQPDVLFVRSQVLPSSFWQRFRDQCLLVARLAARQPGNWHPDHFDVLYTDSPVFYDFFQLHDVATYRNDQGFDERVLEDLSENRKMHDVTFVGGLGGTNFGSRTRLMETLAGQVPSFRWWGYWWPSWTDTRPTDDFPNLQRTFQGPTSGLEMFQLYRDSKIVLNDYVNIAGGLGDNQRMYEVLGVGSFMLTRDAPNFEEQFPGRLFGTYRNAEECCEKIEYYLRHAGEREEIATDGQAHVLDHFAYRDIVRDFDHTLRRHLRA